MDQRKKRKKFDVGIYIILFLIIMASIYFFFSLNNEPTTWTADEYYNIVTNSQTIQVESATFRSVGGDNAGLYYLKGTYIENGARKYYTVILTMDEWLGYNEVAGIKDAITSASNPISLSIGINSSNNWLDIILSLLPIVIMIIFFVVIIKSNSSGNNKAFDFAKSRARLSRDKSITFKDVAGCDEEKQELEEVIDFLKNPRKYIEIGARVPKGILLVGPPGTG